MLGRGERCQPLGGELGRSGGKVAPIGCALGEQVVALPDVALHRRARERAREPRGEIIDDPPEHLRGIRTRALGTDGIDHGVEEVGRDRVPRASPLRLADQDAVLDERANVMADGRLGEPERLGEPPDERSRTGRREHERHEPPPGRIGQQRERRRVVDPAIHRRHSMIPGSGSSPRTDAA